MNMQDHRRAQTNPRRARAVAASPVFHLQSLLLTSLLLGLALTGLALRLMFP